MREPFAGTSGIPPGGWIMRGMLVGNPVGAVVVEPSEAKLLDWSASVSVGGGAVVVGAKARLVGTSREVASSLPVGTIECGASVEVGGGVVSGMEASVDSEPVGSGIGTTPVVDSSDAVL